MTETIQHTQDYAGKCHMRLNIVDITT